MDYLDHLGKPTINTKTHKRNDGRSESGEERGLRERLENPTLLPLMVEYRETSQGRQAVTRS